MQTDYQLFLLWLIMTPWELLLYVFRTHVSFISMLLPRLRWNKAVTRVVGYLVDSTPRVTVMNSTVFSISEQ